MTNLWRWIVSGGLLAALITALLRYLPSREELRERRQAKAEKSNDAKIIQALSDGRSRTANQLAETCKIERDEVDVSLGRLEAKARVKKIDATFTTAISWFLLPR